MILRHNIVGKRVEMFLTYFFFYISMNEKTHKLVEEKIEELYNSLMEKPLQVLGIFNDFFGEERVDMQGYMSLERFKGWMLSAPIKEYVPLDTTYIMSNDELNVYENITIDELPEHQVIKLAYNLLHIKEDIGLLKFDNMSILVHFPHVRVTNENDRFVDINHLWAKVGICYNGTLRTGLTLNRSEYTKLHMRRDYMHSHVCHIPKRDFTQFQCPCLGSGPIVGTIDYLCRDYDEDMWNMFCLELSKYVTVESISGTPYHYLERLNIDKAVKIGEFTVYNSLSTIYTDIYLTSGGKLLKEFVKHFVEKKNLKFNYINGSYSISMSLSEYLILISNEFISWYNDLFNKREIILTFQELQRSEMLMKCIISNGNIYYGRDITNTEEYSDYVGKTVCTFKGKEITIDITNTGSVEDENISVILNPCIALFILNQILKVLNYRYGRKAATYTEYQAGTEVRYL